MGIKLEIVQERGWKRNDPSDPLFCIKFRDSKPPYRLLFTYAPKWEDVPLWLELIKALILYEDYKSQKRRETCKCKLSSACMEESETTFPTKDAE